jgi:hypothetical protein
MRLEGRDGRISFIPGCRYVGAEPVMAPDAPADDGAAAIAIPDLEAAIGVLRLNRKKKVA